MSKKNNLVIILALVFVIAGTAISVYYFSFKNKTCGLVEDYIAQRDRQDVINLFKENWYWLIASHDFSTEFMLDKRAPDKNPRYLGSMYFKVLRIDNQLAGFTASYIKKKDVGRILFLVINEKFRGKGYADLMMKCAIDHLVSLGSKRIILLTREQNIKAQKVYLRLGFTQYKYDPQGFVHYELFP